MSKLRKRNNPIHGWTTVDRAAISAKNAAENTFAFDEALRSLLRPLKICIPFVAIPKKSKKTSSENTTFENSEHPYRTCGSYGWFFYLFGSSPMSVPLKNWWFSEVLFKSLIFFRKTIDFHIFSLKSWSFLWKANDLSRFLFKFVIFVWVIQICISETLNIRQKDPLVTVGSKSAFAQKGQVLKMSLSERPAFSRHSGFQIWDFQNVDSRSNLWVSIKINENRRKSIKHRWKPMNQWKSTEINDHQRKSAKINENP